MAKELICPRDGSPAILENHVGRKKFEIDVCPKCSGVFFDKGEISKLTGERIVEKELWSGAKGTTDVGCPRCGGEMAGRSLGNVVVDICRSCRGVWFDAGELQKAAYELGGIDPSYVKIGSNRERAAGLAEVTFQHPEALVSMMRNITNASRRQL